MRSITRNWTVARKRGHRLYLACDASGQVSFGGMSNNTMFFAAGEFDKQVERLHIPAASVVETPVQLAMQLG